jgi:predicted dehydrogenase
MIDKEIRPVVNMKKINIGIIGLGYWGPNYIRIINELPGVKLKYCCDVDEEKLAKIKDLYPGVNVVRDYEKVLADPKTDGVIITTPSNTHYEIAKKSLDQGKHVLVEKPLTTNSSDSKELIRISTEKDRVLMVGHVYKYNSGVQKLKEMVSTGEIGEIFYCIATRIGLGPIRKHASALWDLAIHDISIATYILDSLPTSVIATGGSYIQDKVEDVAFVTLNFPNRIKYHISVSWYSPEKIRRTLVVGSKKMVIFDDVNKSEMVKIFNKSLDKELLNSTPEYVDHQLIVREGDIYIPTIKQSEPLKNQVEHFLECISENKTPISDGKDGLNIVKILEAAEKSLRDKGRKVEI